MSIKQERLQKFIDFIINYEKKELITKFLKDLKERDNKIDCKYRCANEPCESCTNYNVCDDCNYNIIKKWEVIRNGL